jgi:hypothetical protein
MEPNGRIEKIPVVFSTPPALKRGLFAREGSTRNEYRLYPPLTLKTSFWIFRLRVFYF